MNLTSAARANSVYIADDKLPGIHGWVVRGGCRCQVPQLCQIRPNGRGALLPSELCNDLNTVQLQHIDTFIGPSRITPKVLFIVALGQSDPQ